MQDTTSTTASTSPRTSRAALGTPTAPRGRHRAAGLAASLLALCCAAGAAHADDATLQLTIENHQFSPATLEVAAGQKVKLQIKNLDKTAEEFESDDLHREKLIPGGHEATVVIGPLKPGTYKFKGEFHPKTAQGTIVVK